MITIIAQTKTVALAIARALGADDVAPRYYHNSKYAITWTNGKMVELTTPRGSASYWFRSGSFPFIPRFFTLSLTNRPLEDGRTLTAEAANQLSTIKDLLAKSESVICATDPTHEGELVFRYVYSQAGGKLPVRRAIINDLIYKNVAYAIANALPVENYDKWYRAARMTDEADWLVGMNARRALAFAAGRGTYSIGRTSASVLDIIAKRNKAVKEFTSEQSNYATVGADGITLRSVESVADFSPGGTLTVTKVEKTTDKVKTPKLYTLIQLQMDAAEKFDMTPIEVYAVAMRLFEKKLISFPAPAATTVTMRRYEDCRYALRKLLAYKNFASVAMTQPETMKGRVVGTTAAKTQGIVVTKVPPLVLDGDESKIYWLIVRRMYQAFSKNASVSRTEIEAECSGVKFRWAGVKYKDAGWHKLFPETRISESEAPKWSEGQTVRLSGHGSCTVSTVAPRPFTTATLISELISLRGIGNATGIAKDIDHLEENDLIERDAYGSILLTDRGKALYGIIRGMKIADINEVIRFDNMMHDVLAGDMSQTAFENALREFTSEVTAELLASAKLFPKTEDSLVCPKCGGTFKVFGRIARCTDPGCGHYIFRQHYGIILTYQEISDLLENGSTGVIHGFRSPKGKPFSAKIYLNERGEVRIGDKPKSNP